MSSYFHRLASQVLRPASAIHPFVGTLWSPPHNVEPFESATELSIHPAASRTTQAEPIPHTQPLRSENNHEVAPHVETSHQIIAKSAQETVLSVTPILPLIEPQPLSTQANISSIDATQEFAIETHSDTPRPLIPQAPAQSQHLTLLSVAAAAKAPAAARANSPLRQPLPAPPAREPDEIEIHIGRIEVIAAQPPQQAPRVSPQAPRKSLDLGEYLRRDRRAR